MTDRLLIQCLEEVGLELPAVLGEVTGAGHADGCTRLIGESVAPSGRRWTIAVDAACSQPGSYREVMAPPRRRAEPNTVAAIAEDLVFARDAGGLVRAGAERLTATLALLADDRPDSALAGARELLRACVQRVCARIEQDQEAEPSQVAAARSVRAILLQPADEPVAARAARAAALTRTGCFMAPDSLRKREAAVLTLIAEQVIAEVEKRGPDSMPTTEGLLERLARAADILRGALEPLIDLLVVREESIDEAQVEFFLDYTFWALGELVLWPRAAYDELRAMPDRPIEYWVLEQECLSLLILPFEEDPADAVVLMKAREGAPRPDGFVEALLAKPETHDVAARVWEWLDSCTETCKFHRSHRLASMCGPHQYVCILDDIIDAVKHLRTGEYGREVRQLLGPAITSESATP